MLMLFLLLTTNLVEKDMPFIKPNTQTAEINNDTFPTETINFQPYVWEPDTAMINEVMQAYTPKPIKEVSNVKKWAKVGLWSCVCVVVGNVWLIIATTIILFRGK